jgi:hypothetical protein
MAGLDPAIHVFVSKERKPDVDHRDECSARRDDRRVFGEIADTS